MPKPMNGLVLTNVCSGYHHTAGVTTDGYVVTWGRGVFGQLGHGDNESYFTPKPIEKLLRVPILQVTCGWQHTMALSQDRQVFSWGYGEDGQLGHGDTVDYLEPKEIEFFRGQNVTQVECGHSHSGAICDGEAFMWGLNPDSRLMVEGPESVDSPSLTLMSELRKEDPKAFEIKKISLGVTHSGVITSSGEVFTAGSKLDGQLGS